MTSTYDMVSGQWLSEPNSGGEETRQCSRTPVCTENAITRLERYADIVHDKRVMPPDLAGASVTRFLKSQAAPT